MIENEKLQSSNFKIDVGVRSQFSQGVGFDKKKELVSLAADAQRAKVQFDSLARTFKSTGNGLEELLRQSRRLSTSRSALLSSFDEIKEGSRSFNTLSNNAYQAGQAIEDFAVGFSLNGIAGGIRGAANNVAFILNDMSRLPQVTNAATAAVRKMKPAIPLKEAQQLGAKYAQMIPLAAGIGSALAIVVLPKMVEWIASLGEVEFKLEDITEKIRNAVKDATDFSALATGNTMFSRSLDDAKDIETVLKNITSSLDAALDKQKEIRSVSVALINAQAFSKAKDDLEALSQVVKKNQKDTEAAVLDKPLSFGQSFSRNLLNSEQGRAFLKKTNPTEFSDLLRASEATATVIRSLELMRKAEDSVRRGADDQLESINALSKSYRNISKAIKDTKEISDSGFNDISAANFEKFVTQSEVFSRELSNIGDKASDAANTLDKKLIAGIDAVINKSKELQYGIELAFGEIDNTVPQGTSKINEIFEKNLKLRESLDETLVRVLQSADINVRNRAIEFNAAGTLDISNRTQLELRELLNKSKSDLAKNQRSTFTEIEPFVKKLQSNVLGLDDPLVKSNDDLRKQNGQLERAINLLRIQTNENLKFLPKNADEAASRRDTQISELRVGSIGSVVSMRDREERAASDFKESMRELLNPLGKIVDSTNGTTEAVKKIPGAVAQ